MSKGGPAGKEIARTAWPSFLRGDQGQIVERLMQSDPLRLREGTAKRLREVWYLLEPDRVFNRAVCVCAEGASYEGPPEDLAAWTLGKIDLAIEKLVQADLEAERADPELLTDEDKDFALLTECFMLEPDLVRRVSVAFNALGPLPRRAFFELLIEGRQVEDCIEAGLWNEDGLYEAIHAALATLGLDAREDPPDDPRDVRKK